MKDLFSKQSGTYAKYRPVYPKELYDFIYSQVSVFENAWDAGTGNGQVATQLAKKFNNVLATDISEAQLSNASSADNIVYKKSDETVPFIPDNTFDLITAAAAIHWFDFSTFYTEVKRTAKNKAILAVWCYSLMKVNEPVDSILENFCFKKLSTYWDPERKWVDDGYRDIPFPFVEIEAPVFSIHVHWTLDALAGYLRSWSAVQHYIDANETNPVEEVIKEISSHWNGMMRAELPLGVRVGVVEK